MYKLHQPDGKGAKWNGDFVAAGHMGQFSGSGVLSGLTIAHHPKVCSKFADRFPKGRLRRGARVVMEQIANLSTGNRCRGSNPRLSATKARPRAGLFHGLAFTPEVGQLFDAFVTNEMVAMHNRPAMNVPASLKISCSEESMS